MRASIERILAELAPDIASDYQHDFQWEPRFNLAPTQNVLAFRETNGARELTKLRWGLIPSWAKDAKIGASLINARAETVAEKPSFRAAFKRRRCLIPVDGFYEWEKTSSARLKIPHYITLKTEGLFTFAGLWESWRGEDGTAWETCSVITTTANELMRPLHDRMPVILPADSHADWLSAASDPANLVKLLAPYPSDFMRERAVSSYVSNARHEGPECIA